MNIDPQSIVMLHDLQQSDIEAFKQVKAESVLFLESQPGVEFKIIESLSNGLMVQGGGLRRFISLEECRKWSVKLPEEPIEVLPPIEVPPPVEVPPPEDLTPFDIVIEDQPEDQEESMR